MEINKPIRLNIAQKVCRPLPPLIAQRLGSNIYPRKYAVKDNYQFDTTVITGARFLHHTSDYHAYSIGIYGYYEWRHIAIVMAVCSPKDCIIEVGANIGTETLSFADLLNDGGKLYAFEPLPSNFASLQKNISLNELTNVELYPYAVGAYKNTALFSIPQNEYLSGSGHITPDIDKEKLTNTIEVTCISLDSFINHLNPIKMIVMDAEGSEIMILRGANDLIDRDKPAIILEASHKLLSRYGFQLSDIELELNKYNYRLFKITRFGLVRYKPSVHLAKSNLLCLHKGQIKATKKIQQMIKVCGFLPCLHGINPLNTK